MTVTVGFLCEDGIVLGADSQESYEGSALKRSVPKLIAFPPLEGETDSFATPPDRRALFTGAGDAALVDKLIDEVWAEIGSAAPSVDEIAAAIERRICELYAKYRDLYHPGYMPSAQITFGIWCAGKSSLFHASGPIVNKIGKMTGSTFRSFLGYKAAGIGSEITDYIQARMQATAMPPDVNRAVILTTYMLEQAVAHGEGCGGDIRIVWMKNNGTAENVKIDRHTTLILKELDSQVSYAMLQAANPKFGGAFLDLIWAHTKNKIFKLKADQLEAIEKDKKDKETYETEVAEMEREEEEKRKTKPE